MSSWPVERDPVFGCSLWRGTLTPNGYPVLNDDGRKSAHRVAYERVHGPIADGLVLDHLCRRSSCFAVHHLEPVTKDENERRKSYRYRVRIAKCPRGHDLAQNYAITPEGGKVCRVCNKEADHVGTR